MTELKHLADKFKSLSHHGAGPPPVNSATKPGQPPIPSRASKPSPTKSVVSKFVAEPEELKAGTLYDPGTYPTPDLLPYPLGEYRVLSGVPYTSSSIQSALDTLGPSTTLYLEPGSRWTVTSPITLQPFQELATLGYPTTESEKALLEAAEECKPYVFSCWGKSGIRIRNIAVDGGREKYGWDKDCGVMFSLGHLAVNQTVDRCIIRNPRNWSCIQAFEGSHNVRFTNNFIGPAGVGQDIIGSQWADGISFAGFDGLVAGNQILDATDGAIVIFGAPGTLVTCNTIITRTRLCLGAICMGDYEPNEGNYTYTRVLHNTIISEGSYLKIAIAQGGTCWASNTARCINKGGTVMYNRISAPNNSTGALGYGYAVADVTQWTCLNNVSDPTVKYGGDISHFLPDLIVSPGPFVRDYTPLEKTGRLQSEFVSGRISWLIGIKPGLGGVLSWSPGGFRMRKGERVHIKGIELVFDGVLRIIEKESGRCLWELRSDEVKEGSEIEFHEGGQLRLVEPRGEKVIYHDLIPYLPNLPAKGTPDADPRAPRNETRLILSSSEPHFQIVPSFNATNSVLFSSSYDVGLVKEFHVGYIMLRPQKDGKVLLYTLSPYAQWVVLLSRLPGSSLGFDLSTDKPFYNLVNWGGNGRGKCADDRWEVVWTSSNEPLQDPIYEGDNRPMLAFQGDGNLVIYANGAVWTSYTHHKIPAPKFVRYGDRLKGEPWVALICEDGSTVWKGD